MRREPAVPRRMHAQDSWHVLRDQACQSEGSREFVRVGLTGGFEPDGCSVRLKPDEAERRPRIELPESTRQPQSERGQLRAGPAQKVLNPAWPCEGCSLGIGTVAPQIFDKSTNPGCAGAADLRDCVACRSPEHSGGCWSVLLENLQDRVIPGKGIAIGRGVVPHPEAVGFKSVSPIDAGYESFCRPSSTRHVERGK